MDGGTGTDIISHRYDHGNRGTGLRFLGNNSRPIHIGGNAKIINMNLSGTLSISVTRKLDGVGWVFTTPQTDCLISGGARPPMREVEQNSKDYQILKGHVT